MISKISIACFVLIICISATSAHICLMEPHQRGALDISTSGNPTCFRHGEPCGGVKAGAVSAYYTAGATMFIRFQQNYNHYEVGWPGWLDISWTENSTATSDDDFHVMLTIPDTNVHFQAHQQNYTYALTVPNVNCSNCILRIRYNAQKPGEQTFYQCADISISQPAVDPAPAPVNLRGVAFSDLDSSSEYVSVNTATGSVLPLTKIPFVVRSTGSVSVASASSPFILDQISAFDVANKIHYFLASSSGPIGAFPDRLIAVENDASVKVFDLPQFAFPVNDIQYRPSTKSLVYLSIETFNATLGTYKCRIGSFTPGSNTASTILLTNPDDTFVNFQWSALDDDSGLYYLLMGDENAADTLATRLYIVDVNKGILVNTTSPDYSKYTISSLFYFKSTGLIYTLSPGLTVGNVTWTLVTINPADGSISPVAVIAEPNFFELYYGGAIFGADQEKGLLYYQFLIPGQVMSMIATISIADGSVFFSMPTSLTHVHNLSLLN